MRENKDLISIVVPVYNAEPYLRRCLDSLVSQTYYPTEILLVDDGSTDQSGMICDEYANEYGQVKVFHKVNGGVSSARNTGIEKASGKYIMFVDADDSVHPQLLSAVMDVEERGWMIICDKESQISVLDKKWEGGWEKHVEQVQEAEFMQMFERDYINPPYCKLYEAEIVKNMYAAFPEGCQLGEDLFFNLGYLSHDFHGYKIIHCPLYYYQEGSNGSLSNSYYAEMFLLQIRMFQAIEAYLKKKNYWNSENRKIYYRMYWDRIFMTYRQSAKIERKKMDISVFEEIWNGCKAQGQVNWKRRMKRAYIYFDKFLMRR